MNKKWRLKIDVPFIGAKGKILIEDKDGLIRLFQQLGAVSPRLFPECFEEMKTKTIVTVTLELDEDLPSFQFGNKQFGRTKVTTEGLKLLKEAYENVSVEEREA